MSFSKTLFGFKPGEVMERIEKMENEHQKKIVALEAEIAQVQTVLKDTEATHSALQERLRTYIERENIIAEVLVTAQVNAQKIEEQARERATAMLQKTEAELKHKQRELDLLRTKVSRFKDEFREVLDNYRLSLEKIDETPEEVGFLPTLIIPNNESKKTSRKSKDS